MIYLSFMPLMLHIHIPVSNKATLQNIRISDGFTIFVINPMIPYAMGCDETEAEVTKPKTLPLISFGTILWKRAMSAMLDKLSAIPTINNITIKK